METVTIVMVLMFILGVCIGIVLQKHYDTAKSVGILVVTSDDASNPLYYMAISKENMNRIKDLQFVSLKVELESSHKKQRPL
jgi:Na+-transporting NADH:ubiquinone oxidoreductase subunit NqrE